MDTTSSTVEIEKELHRKIKERTLLDKEWKLPSELNMNYLRLTNVYRNEYDDEQKRDIYHFFDVLLMKSTYYEDKTRLSYQESIDKMQQTYTNSLPIDERNDKVKLPDYCNNRVDVIWTFVNGSDPHWIKTYEDKMKVKIEKQRFREYGSLKYSMRSVFENLPYVHWHLIVQDEYQIPTFLDKSKLIYYNDESTPGSLRIIYHRDYFPDPSVLPVFNSNAIEIAMYNLKGVGECFIYLNDDFFINSPVHPSLIFTEKGQIITRFDYVYTNSPKDKGIMYDKANANAVELINKYLNEPLRRHRSSHHWGIMRTSVLKKGGELFSDEFKKTCENPLRTEKDIGFYTFLDNFMYREGYSIQLFNNPKTEKRVSLQKVDKPNRNLFENEISKKKHPFVCINDDMKGDEVVIKQTIEYFVTQMENNYPNKSPFEL